MKKSLSIIHWTPRILCILAILFISMFAFDAFSEGRSFWENLAGFLIHLIPSFVLIALLIVAWKWELVGGIIFGLIGLGFGPWVFIKNFRMNHSVGTSLAIVAAIALPFMLVGILFVISHYMKKKRAA
ncbi:MAG: hypothetical protein RBS37_10095 [Bacteroidales bacterium]|jgi:hypothetical protein|nr:hypothetical protein [Bacteroidales bacterium]